ncbi:MAG: M20/M25/M40 family metallo-hydrolase [Chloroflexota bacterium]
MGVEQSITTVRIVELIDEMVSIQSVTGHEQPMANWVANFFEHLGADEVHRLPVEEAGETIVAIFNKEGRGAGMLLNFHLDTFPVFEDWETPPFETVPDGNKLFGLGTHDMKGGAACLLAAVEAMVHGKTPLEGQLIVAATSDEENWSRGAHALVNSGLIKDCEYCLIPEPSRPNTLTIGARGRHVFRLLFTGRTVHSAYGGGINAVVDAAKVAAELDTMPTDAFGFDDMFQLHGTQCVIGLKGGGTLVLMPEKAELFIDRFLLPGQTSQWAEDQIRAAVQQANIAGTYELFIDERPTPAPTAYVVPPDSKFVQTVHSILAEETKVQLDEIALDLARSVADTNHIAVYGGVPTMICGPLGGNTCEANEYVLIDSLLAVSRTYARSVIELIGGSA